MDRIALNSRLNSLTDEELLAVASGTPCSPQSVAIVTEAIAIQFLDEIQVYAETEYWARRLKSVSLLSDHDVDELLAKHGNVFARGLLGTAAEDDKLTETQLSRIANEETEDRYITRPVRARSLVNQINEQLESGADGETIVALFAQLYETGLAWPVRELAERLPVELLDPLDQLALKYKFTRVYRHEVRAAFATARKKARQSGKS